MRRELTENHFIHQTKRSTLLDLAGMKRRSRNVESRISRNLIKPSSAALNLPSVCLRARAIALRMADSAVRPMLTRECAVCRNIKCHPILRTCASRVAAVAFSTDIHFSSNRVCISSIPTGRMQPARRNMALNCMTTTSCWMKKRRGIRPS